MAKDFTDLLPDVPNAQKSQDLLPDVARSQFSPFSAGQIGKDVVSDTSRLFDVVPNLLKFAGSLPEEASNSWDLLRNDPSTALKLFASSAGQAGSHLFNAPAQARDYGVSRGILPESTPSFKMPEWLSNPNADYRGFYGVEKPVEGENLFNMLGSAMPTALGTAVGGPAALPALMSAQSVGAGEGPLTPFLLGKLAINAPKTARSYSASSTAKDISKAYRKGQQYFGKEYDQIFNSKGVPKHLGYTPSFAEIEQISSYFPKYAENLIEYMQNKSPFYLNKAKSDLKALQRDLVTKGVDSSVHGPSTYKMLDKMVPRMEQIIDDALAKGGSHLPKRFAKVNQKYKKDMVPISQDVRNAIRTYESGLGSPLSVGKAARGTDYEMFAQRYGKDIPGVRRAITDSYISNMLKSPLAWTMGIGAPAAGFAPKLYENFAGE